MNLSEGSGVIKRVSQPFLLNSSKTLNKLIGVLNFNILKISLKQLLYIEIGFEHSLQYVW